MEYLASHIYTTGAVAAASLSVMMVMVVTDADLSQVGPFRAIAALFCASTVLLVLGVVGLLAG